MGLSIAEQYYLKAKGAMSGFCPNWEEACESLNYALSYDEEHLPSLHLLGIIKSFYLNDHRASFEYFDKIITIDNTYSEVYLDYAYTLINAGKHMRATRLLTYCIQLNTVDKSSIYKAHAYLKEKQGLLKESIKLLKAARKHAYNSYYFDFLNKEIKRIKSKTKKKKKKKKKKAKIRKKKGKKKSKK